MKKTTFLYIVTKFEEIEKISSRNDISKIISELFVKLTIEERQALSYILLGRVAPLFVISEFNMSEKSIFNFLKNTLSSRMEEYDLMDRRIKLGDIGEVVKEVTEKLGYFSKKLLLMDIYDSMWRIVLCSGVGSSEKKANIVGELFKNMSPIECKYLSRIICGELRLGINAKSILDAFSNILQGDKGKRKLLDRIYGINPDLGYVSTILESEKNISTTIIPGIPILSRLVERVGSFEEVFERLGEEFFVQPKYDGLRCQIHKYDESTQMENNLIWKKYVKKENDISLFKESNSTKVVKLFTRNLEDVTDMFPEVVEDVMKIKEKSFILDSEILGWNKAKGKFFSYQETMQRRRKYGVGEKLKVVPVRAMVFDLLYLNGKDISEQDTEKRIEQLNKIETDTLLGISKSPIDMINEMFQLKKIFNKWVKEGHEGVVVKKKTGKYLPGIRNYGWVKLKKSMIKELVDTIDLVAVGYYYGSGKRGSFGVGAVLGAIYNDKNNTYEAVCKVGTGFSNTLLSDIYKRFKNTSFKKRPINILVEDTLMPDMWVNPEVVFSVESDEITRNLKANKNIANGLSLRFPRLVEWGRDKTVEEATSLTEITRLFSLQKKKK